MSENNETKDSMGVPDNFICDIIDEHNKTEKYDNRVVTRFPPEPNGYLHIGHAKSICLNFGIASKYQGKCNLRFDDSNPCKEEQEYVDSIKEDVKWLGAEWAGEYYASDYFEKMYEYAIQLIKAGKAYICELNGEEVSATRGTLTEPGQDSPGRGRSVEENLDIFQRMRAGEFEDGKYTLRAKIDMASPNFNMRDPIMYRIRHAHHHRQGDKWCIYPMYDYCHCVSDSMEDITHSICTLEFEDHRPLYDWFLTELEAYRPQQIEFARLNITYTVMSKRKLLQLVQEKHVSGWDDPRMPTIAGIRRRGYTPAALHDFCDRIGVAKADSTVDIALLEFCLREDLNHKTQRVMGVIDPLKVTIQNYPEGQVEEFDADNNSNNPDAGTRKVPFSRVIYVEKEDFAEEAPKKWFRLAPGKEVRLKHAYYITCDKTVKDPETGEVTELICSYDPESRGGDTPDKRKVKGTLHWVSAEHAVDAEVRLFDHLFAKEDPYDVEEGQEWLENFNPDSIKVLKNAKLEPSLKDAAPGDAYQFLRLGYFCLDAKDSSADSPVFNRIVNLRDAWARMQKKKK